MIASRLKNRWSVNTMLLATVSLLCGPTTCSPSIATAAEPTHVRVAIKHIPPFVFTDGSEPRGFSIELWNELAKALGVSTEFVPFASVREIIAAAQEKRVDVGIAAITISADREGLVDFSHPFYRSGLRIGVPTRSGPSWLATIARFFSLDLLAMLTTLLAMTIVASHLLWFVERGVNPECFPKTYLAGVGEAMWWSVATIITGGCENKSPVSVLGRLVAVAWMLGSIVLVASFTATLASQMTAETVSGVVSGPEGLPGRLVATVAGTSAATDLLDRKARVHEYADLTEAIQETARGHVEAVVFDAPVLAHALKENPEAGVRLIGPVFEHQDYGVVLPRGSPLRKSVNQVLLQLAEAGKLAELNIKWFGEQD
ncbi:MAG: transporter substrate-binding domain-containing protein [Actinomycetota bacterium]